MKDFNEKLRERWQQKRSKASNWVSLLIKVAILIVIIIALARLGTNKNLDWSKFKSNKDTVRTIPDSTQGL